MAARRRVDSLTSLRFFAALYVLLFHTETAVLLQHHAAKLWVTFAGHGYLAVSFFFILSGFLLTWTYADRWDSGSFKSFLLARFARIYPVYLLALLIQLPFYMPKAHLLPTLAVLLMVQSWTMLPSGLPGAWNFPAWTLSVEWFFYLMFPLLLAALVRLRNGRLVIGVTIATSLLIGGAQAAIGGRPSWFTAHIPLPLLRLPEFFLGMLIAKLPPPPAEASPSRILDVFAANCDGAASDPEFASLRHISNYSVCRDDLGVDIWGKQITALA